MNKTPCSVNLVISYYIDNCNHDDPLLLQELFFSALMCVCGLVYPSVGLG